MKLLYSGLLLAACLVPLGSLHARHTQLRWVPSTGPPREVHWKKIVLDTRFRSEGVAVADVNRDGKPDILTGDLWYEAPDWKPHEIKHPGDYNPATGYSDCFACFAADVDGDGWPDEICAGFPGAKITWFKNPRGGNGPWPEYPVTDAATNESPLFADLDGDGKPGVVCPYQGRQMAYYKPGPKPREGWVRCPVGLPNGKGSGHGLGVGDVNGDGRLDILCTEGYWVASPDRTPAGWTFVPAALGPDCAQMYVYDFNGDGLPDVISSSAHNFGVWWYEQKKGASGPEFVQHEIDRSFSQSHALVMADINGDGQPDFVTGKRWWAHGPNGDVNPNDPAVFYWFEFKRQAGQVVWTKHLIDSNSGVGTQFTVADVNGDGRLDVVTSNKKGVFLFEQVT